MVSSFSSFEPPHQGVEGMKAESKICNTCFPNPPSFSFDTSFSPFELCIRINTLLKRFLPLLEGGRIFSRDKCVSLLKGF
jgi:hypothetical protein